MVVAFLAECTLVGPVLDVAFSVHHQLRPFSEAPLTFKALKDLLPSVSPLVQKEDRPVDKGFVAVIALKDLSTRSNRLGGNWFYRVSFTLARDFSLVMGLPLGIFWFYSLSCIGMFGFFLIMGPSMCSKLGPATEVDLTLQTLVKFLSRWRFQVVLLGDSIC